MYSPSGTHTISLTFKEIKEEIIAAGLYLEQDSLFLERAAKEEYDSSPMLILRGPNKQIIAWSYSAQTSRGIEIQIYVHPKYRRLGYGTYLVRLWCNKHPGEDVQTYSHDFGSYRFYKSVRSNYRADGCRILITYQ